MRNRRYTLDAWLAAATRGLCDDAKERIGEEVGGHFEAAGADALGNGIDEADAVASAVASLGSARAARRRFKREHFTAGEARFFLEGININLEVVSSWRFWLLYAIATASIPVLFYFFYPHYSVGNLLGQLTAIPFGLAAVYLSQRIANRFRAGSRESRSNDIAPEARIRSSGFLPLILLAGGALLLWLPAIPLLATALVPAGNDALHFGKGTATLMAAGALLIAVGSYGAMNWRRRLRIFERRYAGREAR